ncbi:c-type cytochrome biogenesis protein CcsB [Psychrobacillus sp. Sa2BUA9]|uniref:C-type cytochrome biogenesis protein CcsB n=1 Tax=Psychrobacillus faecigallinarum TaxID=2762235 RepID=A0ABR8R9I7_9BACI|nr:c-type cytochrome biogenesis protein CcsB [Psychrobacillus faecigallinarum]MBD7944463.1 c-type cytochrome biogenesis protein CcsB [Psychrobacillus faecigallinarum]
MSFDSLTSISSASLYLAFILYLIAILPFGFAIRSKKKTATTLALSLTVFGFVAQLNYFVLRWIASGHAPVSNLYEFMTFFGLMLVGGFFLVYYLYRQVVIGLFLMPIAILIIAYGSMFSKEITPLIPALQSNWLTIHVITVAIASAILSLSFVTGLIYLIKQVDHNKKGASTFFLEFVLYQLIVVLGFVTISGIFGFLHYNASYQFVNQQGNQETYQYSLPAIVTPNNALPIDDSGEELKGKFSGLVQIPVIFDAAKLNTLIWSYFIGSILYILIRLFSRKSISKLLQPLTQKVNLTLMDEISYRVIVIGFPLFALGGLFFAMIWAHLAWSRFWGWDPKEVWALITFLFYTAFLHLRINRGWDGERTAWLAIIGFGTIMFNQIFVNLVIAGLHSYA